MKCPYCGSTEWGFTPEPDDKNHATCGDCGWTFECWHCDNCGDAMRKPAGAINQYPDNFNYFMCAECLDAHFANERRDR